MRLYFATDVHGSETCWRKFLNAAQHYKADVLVLGGDMTGKALVPIIDDGDGKWHATLLEVRDEMTTEEEVAAFEDGGHPPRLLPVPHRPRCCSQKLSEDESHWHGLFQEKMLETVEKWMRMAEERLARHRRPRLLLPGQRRPVRGRRDHREREARSSSREGRVVDIDGFQMVSTGWANRTPWHTYREEDEPDLHKRLEEAIAQVTAPAERTVFSFHCPPYRTGLDDAPRADGGHDAQGRGPRREAGRLDGGAPGDRGAPAGALAPRPHPRGARQLPHRPNALH